MSSLAQDDRNNVAQVITPGASQNVAIGAASTQSAAFSQSTTMVRVAPTVDCRIALGLNPTADATSMLLFGGQPEVVAVGRGHKVAVIQQSGGGTLNVVEVK